MFILTSNLLNHIVISKELATTGPLVIVLVQLSSADHLGPGTAAGSYIEVQQALQLVVILLSLIHI